MDFNFDVVEEPQQVRSGNRWKGIMKCYPFEESRLLKWKPPFMVQPKYDGDRCRNVGGEKSLLLTSEEHIFDSVPHINEQLDKSGYARYPWDGELYSHPLFLEGGHELIHSIASRTKNIHPRYKEINFIVFDIKVPNLSQVERLRFINSIEHTTPNIMIAPHWICNSLSEIKKVYDKIIYDGYEGVIIRNLNNIYEEKRSTMIMKFKPKRYDVYKIVGWNEEVSIHGEPKGRIGSLILSSQSGDMFAVSAGLDDDDRERLWTIRESLAGRSAKVGYQHLTNKQIPKGCFDITLIEEEA